MKIEERITKTSQDGSPQVASKKPWRLLKAALTLTVLASVAFVSYEAYRNRPTSEAEIAHIESLIVLGQDQEARTLMVGAQQRSRDVIALRLRVGRAYLRQGLIGPATALLSKVEEGLIKEERLVVAEYFLVAGDPFSAVRFYEAAMRTGMARTASLLGRYGEALSLSGNGDAAVAALKESVELDASRTGIRVSLAVTLANLNRLEEAKVETLAVLEADPTNAKAQKLLAALGGR